MSATSTITYGVCVNGCEVETFTDATAALALAERLRAEEIDPVVSIVLWTGWINDGPDCYCCEPGCGKRLIYGSCPEHDHEVAVMQEP